MTSTQPPNTACTVCVHFSPARCLPLQNTHTIYYLNTDALTSSHEHTHAPTHMPVQSHTVQHVHTHTYTLKKHIQELTPALPLQA